jgi:hypothetical protein
MTRTHVAPALIEYVIAIATRVSNVGLYPAGHMRPVIAGPSFPSLIVYEATKITFLMISLLLMDQLHAAAR